MIRPDGKKIQEVKDHFNLLCEQEIIHMTAKVREVEEDPERELKEDEINSVRHKHQSLEKRHLDTILALGPEKLYKSGFGFNTVGGEGWRAGYTKPLLSKRTAKRRTLKKLAKKVRQQQRKK